MSTLLSAARWLAAGVLLTAAGSRSVAAQCSVLNNVGENVYVKDPLAGCRRTAIVNGNAAANPIVRRGLTTHVIIVRHFVEQYKDKVTPSRGSIANKNAGIANGIGFLEFDLTLNVGDAQGGLSIDFGPTLVLGLFRLNLTVISKGEITGFTQTPSPARWGDPVNVSLTGNDIQSPGINVASHTVSNLTSTANAVSFRVQATSGSTARTSTAVELWDTSVSRAAGLFMWPGHSGGPALVYSTAAGTPCASVPGIGAPILGTPANGSVMTFSSPTSPVSATVTFAFNNTGDPQGKYLLHVEKSIITATLDGSIGTRTSTSIGTVGTITTEETVTAGPSGNVSVVKNLERNRAYKWKARAVNCGQSAPFSTVSAFTVR